jgi:hypothetical protein
MWGNTKMEDAAAGDDDDEDDDSMHLTTEKETRGSKNTLHGNNIGIGDDPVMTPVLGIEVLVL